MLGHGTIPQIKRESWYDSASSRSTAQPLHLGARTGSLGEPVLSWRGERAIRRSLGFHDSFEYKDGKVHIPDAEAEIFFPDTGEIWLIDIEVERSYKGPGRTDEILECAARQYQHIWYFCPATPIYPLIERRIQCLPQSDVGKFEMWELDTIVCDPPKTQFTSNITQV
jgi:hypothetical protein